MEDKPIYVTNYRSGINKEMGYSDDELAEGLLLLAESGATLCDVMGDYYDKNDRELTFDARAVDKQLRLIDKLHEIGAEVLMSTHITKSFHSADEILSIAHEQEKRGADICKIVTGAENTDQQIENLRIINLLKENLKIPFLFLSGGECHIMRRIGGLLGCCMYLCVREYDEYATKSQPLLHDIKIIRDIL
jgi:3-dehydroquinate dehydratase